MIREDVVVYLRAHLKKFPVELLRRQLSDEGVTDKEFDTAFEQALGPSPAPAKTAVIGKKSGVLAKFFLFGGLAAILAAAVLAVIQKSPVPQPQRRGMPEAPELESGFIGHYGYVIKLPPGYAARAAFKDKNRTVEVVHFCKSTTDPANFLNEGLFGQLGIVRLEVMPSPFIGRLDALDVVVQMIGARARQRGEKYTTKNLQISTLRGVQFNYEAPFPRVETYILGQKVLFSILAGHDDEIYRGLIESLRDARSEI